MFALIAALVFFLALLGVHIGSISMLLLGLMFVAIHLAFAVPVMFWNGYRRRP